jgi:hypothetical protein
VTTVAFTLSTSDAYPYVCGIYSCPCGKRSVRHGREAATLPPGWEERPVAGGESMQICEVCAGRAAKRPD